jgi:DNA-binding NtrC family response regulator
MHEDAAILVVDDDEVACQLLEEVLKKEGYRVIATTTGREAIQHGTTHPFDLAIVDIRMPDLDGLEVLKALKRVAPDMSIIMVTAYGSIDTAIEATKAGAYDYLAKPFKMEELRITVQRALEQRRLLQENLYFRQELRAKYRLENIIGSSPAMFEVYKTVARVVNSKSTVLVCGESGTGKELIARAIHFNSPRAERPFITIDCAAMPATLLESELFGHVKGAFTGAVAAKKGLFELAHGGTCFLDEVGEIPLALQAKLLRVLQEHEVRRVGGTEVIPIDVRVLGATNRHLETMVQEGNFREDLFYRLDVVTITLPPLRERRDDIPLLANHFCRLYSAENRKAILHIAPEAMARLMSYDWPGNVRELENVIERAIALTTNTVIFPEDLPLKFHQEKVDLSLGVMHQLLSLDELEKRYLQQVLQETQGNKTRAAEILGINRRTLYRMAKRYRIPLE